MLSHEQWIERGMITYVEVLHRTEDDGDVKVMTGQRVGDLSQPCTVRAGDCHKCRSITRTIERTAARIGIAVTTPIRVDRAILIHNVRDIANRSRQRYAHA